ncbi:glycosyltransferase family 9 protein [Tautonia plasticadhaerens]|uniref:Lipopolysaccharide core heptosyltransferase RfaQ n=1 Tax=Tautonia plasticadhaerens TaxID=2527974 RepID=A0A518H5Z9_9BACT|nr:glycosyltransferase family 9 protein [Tautonia plasticadhaerens]QDV36265.1 Lipopolysaccharide core heptosyltransferase RfaQ [Tautonia plasticadhaerens]
MAIFRALQLGDMLCAVPALRAFRAALPDAELVLIGLPWAKSFASRFRRYLDGFREFPGFPGLPERAPEVGRIPGFFSELQAERFDLAVQMHGSGLLTNPLVERIGAGRCAGFFRLGGRCPDPETFMPWPEEGLEVRRLLRLPEYLGAPPRGEELEFPLDESDARSLREALGEEELGPMRYCCIHAGASVPGRCWPPGRFAAVAETLSRCGLKVVLTGTASEADRARAVARGLRGPFLDMTGRTGLGALGALLSGARLLICNDTGVSHVAAALRVPSVVLSTGDNPSRWAPADSRLHRVLCPAPDVHPGAVIAEAEDLLRLGRVGPGRRSPGTLQPFTIAGE